VLALASHITCMLATSATAGPRGVEEGEVSTLRILRSSHMALQEGSWGRNPDIMQAKRNGDMSGGSSPLSCIAARTNTTAAPCDNLLVRLCKFLVGSRCVRLDACHLAESDDAVKRSLLNLDKAKQSSVSGR